MANSDIKVARSDIYPYPNLYTKRKNALRHFPYMKLYITEFFHGTRSFEGPRIVAADSAHAERQARELGVELVGELVGKCDIEGNEIHVGAEESMH